MFTWTYQHFYYSAKIKQATNTAAFEEADETANGMLTAQIEWYYYMLVLRKILSHWCLLHHFYFLAETNQATDTGAFEKANEPAFPEA